MKSKLNRRYGWIPDLPDHRDFEALGVTRTVKVEFPARTDLRESGLLPCVYDQGQLNSCVGNAAAAAVAYDMARQNRTVFTAAPSRLFIYYQARAYQGWQGQDNGCFIRDAFKGIAKYGVCSEKDWAYVEGRVTWRPTAPCYTDALGEQSVSYGRLNNTDRDTMKILLFNGYPIVGGFTVYESFESEDVRRTGMVPMPSNTESVLGGHAILVVGYDDALGRYIVQNSWGTDFGDKGYLYMPYEYLENPNLAADFWVVTQME